MAGLEGLAPGFRAQLQALINASGGKISVGSGYRGEAEQAGLVEKAKKEHGADWRNWAAPPGASNHNKGFAADLRGDMKLAHKLAPQFGLTFPMAHEDWHIEPMGLRDGTNEEAYTVPPAGFQTPAADPVDSKMNELASLLGGAGGLPEGSVPQLGTPIGQQTATAAGDGTVNTNVQVGKLTAEQIANAAAIIRVGKQRGMSPRAMTIALATAMQESKLRNLNYGDRDSKGLFQQRPSQGWGTVEQVRDPVYAANKFYDGLSKIKGYETLPVTVAAQKVQRSAFPDAYAQWESIASELVQKVGGY